MYIREYKFNIPLKDNAYKHTHTHVESSFFKELIGI